MNSFNEEFNDLFARHRFGFGNKNDIKLKLTLNNEIPAYGQNLQTPINLKDEPNSRFAHYANSALIAPYQ